MAASTFSLHARARFDDRELSTGDASRAGRLDVVNFDNLVVRSGMAAFLVRPASLDFRALRVDFCVLLPRTGFRASTGTIFALGDCNRPDWIRSGASS